MHACGAAEAEAGFLKDRPGCERLLHRHVRLLGLVRFVEAEQFLDARFFGGLARIDHGDSAIAPVFRDHRSEGDSRGQAVGDFVPSMCRPICSAAPEACCSSPASAARSRGLFWTIRQVFCGLGGGWKLLGGRKRGHQRELDEIGGGSCEVVSGFGLRIFPPVISSSMAASSLTFSGFSRARFLVSAGSSAR